MPALEHKFIGSIRGKFIVRSYQRGYRWDTDDVRRLLDDIFDNGRNPYSLQPVVVKLHQKGNNDQTHEWELIDGQQRMTTLYLIFLYMQKKEWKKLGAPFKIDYETRPICANYLETVDKSRRDENIDFSHIYKAYEYIDKWFTHDRDEHEQEDIVSTFSEYLKKFVRVIWYEVPQNMDSITLFTRLNVGRIPLTDAELVKAQLLLKADQGRIQEIAAQWDSIERELHNPDIWAFVIGAKAIHDHERYATRIILLLDTLADAIQPIQPGCKRPRYHTFDMLCTEINMNAIEFWNKVVGLHATVLGWFGNPTIHNKIGFLVATNTSFGELVNWADNIRKSEFDALLVGKIQAKINTCASSLMTLSYDNKYKGQIFNILLLMNVETISRTGQRFPFAQHVGKKWSLEHIHAQNAENLTKVEDWTEWLNLHKKALRVLIEQDDNLSQEIATTLNNNVLEKNTFLNLSDKIIRKFDAPDIQNNDVATEHDLHSISNLALLANGHNSALSNSVFEVKRQRILEIDYHRNDENDGYIPICTRNVFLKYYTDTGAQQIHVWSQHDRRSYLNAIIETLNPYFQPEIMGNQQ